MRRPTHQTASVSTVKPFLIPIHAAPGDNAIALSPMSRKASKASQPTPLATTTPQPRLLQRPHPCRTRPAVAQGQPRRLATPGLWGDPYALQEDLTLSRNGKHNDLTNGLAPHALQDSFFMQPTIFVGLIAHLTGLSFQEDIAMTARRLQQLGHDILCGSTH